jgi:hypothetical protein
MRSFYRSHNFHIPVMGIGFTIDTPVKVAHLGISSVVSLVDDMLMEKMREFYSKKLDIPFHAISDKVDDFRAERITTYLNLLDSMVKEKFTEMKNMVNESQKEIDKYMEMLPDLSSIKQKFHELVHNNTLKADIQQWLHENLPCGHIDVNIMTKVDRANYLNGDKLPSEFNDAHAALRGFANSTLSSSVVLSAGMNNSLYAYLEQFEDFYPNAAGELVKRVILKVSDYRSALIQGKFLAKKGIWVSEFRVESGLNCGGHAFATDGYLMGPILEEFKNNRDKLSESMFEIYTQALKSKDRFCPDTAPDIYVTAQGGIGTHEEHQFLIDYYSLDSVGWGTPFLLVPEVVNVDDKTLELLSNAKEEDLYLSDISPLNVPFNSLRNNTKDLEKEGWIADGRPGSPCPKKYVALNQEFSEKPICSASRQFQRAKIRQIDEQNMINGSYQKAFDKVVEKSCICVGLGTAALLVNNLETKVEGSGVSVCPGPNMAYFSKVVSLKEMTDHIYGRTNLVDTTDRPHVFIKELDIYINYLKARINEHSENAGEKQYAHFEKFRKNLMEGIAYYQALFSDRSLFTSQQSSESLSALRKLTANLNEIFELQAKA